MKRKDRLKPPFISVIVPVYNGEVFLERCLDALAGSIDGNAEIIVVNDQSTDRSVEIAQERGVRMLATETRSGPAVARNLAAREAEGEILLFVDADVVVQPDTVRRTAEAFDWNPDVAALFGSYDDQPGEANFLSQYKNLCHHYVHQISDEDASTFWAGLGAIRRDVFLSVGGFDADRYAVPSIEDIELGVRLRTKGHRILLVKDLQAKHLKKWTPISLIKTDILCRALPWSRLILERDQMINDLNLRTSDRVSALLVGLIVLSLPAILFQPMVVLLTAILLGIVGFLNRNILSFFVANRGFIFAAKAFFWQLVYFFYSGTVFVSCWIYSALRPQPGFFSRKKRIDGT